MRLDKFDGFLILDSGNRILKKKINGKKCQIPFLSKDEYEDLNDPQLIGYASVKRSRTAIEEDAERNTENIIGLLDYESDSISVIRTKKHKFKSIKGYFDIGCNQYVAIEKNSLFIFLIPLLLILLIIGLCASCGGLNNVDPEPEDPWHPVIEENLGEYQESTTERLQNVIYGFDDWHVAEGKTKNLPITLTNAAGNSGYFSFIITLKDTGEELYRSAMVKPGDTIKSIDISRPLEEGQYTAFVKIIINDLENGNEMCPFDFQIKITVD